MNMHAEIDKLYRDHETALRLLNKNKESFLEESRDSQNDLMYRFDCLLRYTQLERTIEERQVLLEYELAAFRYLKGVEIIKMIYEKILSLDHHFTSLSGFKNIVTLSNPNSFPEFVKFKEDLLRNTKARNRVNLPQLLDNNTMFSMGYTLIYSLFGTSKHEIRTNRLEEISCLLDFTLSMQSDLKIIYYETDYLAIQNKNLMNSCYKLFDDYTQAILYTYGLKYCREHDNWQELEQKLNASIEILRNEKINKKESQYADKLIELKFSIDLLMNFISKYSGFVDQAKLYYDKFLRIISNYNNKEICLPELPAEYESLEEEIRFSIEKFESAYNITELRGSKLRELMYGTPG